ncbi:PREDICTED: complement factor H-like, partial [Capra hircus]|uniref:complement factor H-like n=1 Tax=Capra hircus TaxID=9925 RepID=UPI00084672E2
MSFLTLWFYTAHGQGKHCNYPVIKHGRLYHSYRGRFPAHVNQQFLYNCDQYFVSPSQYSSDYLTCTAEGWSPEEPCLRECIFHNLENGYNPSSEKKVLQGETVRVRCYHGYSLQNYRNIMTCTESGWSPPPRCIRVSEWPVGHLEANRSSWVCEKAHKCEHLALPQGSSQKTVGTETVFAALIEAYELQNSLLGGIEYMGQ